MSAAGFDRQGSLIRQLQGALGGSSFRSGVATATWGGASDATGNVVITHEFGHTPSEILLTCGLRSDGGVRAYASHFNEGATTFTAVAIATGANPAAGVTVPINWLAIG